MMAKTKTDASMVQVLRIELAVRTDLERFLRSAVRLAKMMDTGLEVVFREDREMLDAAALPFVHEVCLWTGEERLTSSKLMASSMRIQARQAHKLLAHIAQHEAVAFTFVSEQDARPAGERVLATAVQWVGGRCLSTRSENCPVCVLAEAGGSDRDGLQQALAFARRTGRALKIYTLGDTDRVTGLNGDVTQVAVEDFERWLQHAGEMGCFVLFMPRRLYSDASAMKALHSVPYPVLLV